MKSNGQLDWEIRQLRDEVAVLRDVLDQLALAAALQDRLDLWGKSYLFSRPALRAEFERERDRRGRRVGRRGRQSRPPLELREARPSAGLRVSSNAAARTPGILCRAKRPFKLLHGTSNCRRSSYTIKGFAMRRTNTAGPALRCVLLPGSCRARVVAEGALSVVD